MAGLYIHVPFCAKRCLYCDFFSNTSMEYKEPYLSALLKEMEMQKDYLDSEPLETIYFGGGTPSQLSAADFESIFEHIFYLFPVEKDMEITLEANPDDMTEEYVSSLQSLPFNRISMGIQSFHEDDLRFLNRRHTAKQAKQAVSLCKEKGFHNISIDLIYGLPNQSIEAWQRNLNEAIQLDIPHISAYHLIYEEGTKLNKLKEEGKVNTIDEEVSESQFIALIDTLQGAGYEHYEISNFAKPGYISKHNSSYWLGNKYLGLGPSAHSYNGENRQWNVLSLRDYLQGIDDHKLNIQLDFLTDESKYNDYIITGLRTMWGISLSHIMTEFGRDKLNYCLKQATPFIDRGLLRRFDDKLLLSRDGIFISDSIMSDLLWV